MEFSEWLCLNINRYINLFWWPKLGPCLVAVSRQLLGVHSLCATIRRTCWELEHHPPPHQAMRFWDGVVTIYLKHIRYMRPTWKVDRCDVFFRLMFCGCHLNTSRTKQKGKTNQWRFDYFRTGSLESYSYPPAKLTLSRRRSKTYFPNIYEGTGHGNKSSVYQSVTNRHRTNNSTQDDPIPLGPSPPTSCKERVNQKKQGLPFRHDKIWNILKMMIPHKIHQHNPPCGQETEAMIPKCQGQNGCKGAQHGITISCCATQKAHHQKDVDEDASICSNEKQHAFEDLESYKQGLFCWAGKCL